MPVLVSFFVRQLIIIGVQLGIFALIDKYITPLLNDAISAIVQAFGVSESTAQDILANEILTTAESLGLTVALSKARLPLALADKLGFTTKGFSKRAVPTSTAAKVAAGSTSVVAGVIADIVPSLAESTTIITAAKTGMSGFANAYRILLSTLSTLFIGFIAVNNLIDFGNWNSGAYQKTFQKIFAAVSFGLLVPDADYRKTKTVSPEVFDKVYNTYKNSGAFAISDPFKKASVAFTRDNLIDLLDQVGAKLLLTTQKAATKDVLLASQLFIQFPVSEDTTTTPAPVAKETTLPSVKVFTGVVSQGTLGTGIQFTPRPDDLIESAQELQDAAANNLAATLVALPSSLVYEIKVVSSVTTKDGFTQRGTVQQIVSGYKADGTPKYRTVVNKFAVLSVYLINEKGTRTKIRQITLGPTDVVRFNPSVAALSGVETNLKASVHTANVADIKLVVPTSSLVSTAVSAFTAPTAMPTSAQVAPSATPSALSAAGVSYNPVWADFGLTLEGWNKLTPASRDAVIPRDGQTGAIITLSTKPAAAPPPVVSKPTSVSTDFSNSRIQGDYVYDLPDGSGGFYSGPVANAPSAQIAKLTAIVASNAPTPVSAIVAAVATTPKTGVCSSNTLYELSVALGERLPTVAARAPQYQALGLGQASFYTGTAEQNIKLLAALKKQAGCGA